MTNQGNIIAGIETETGLSGLGYNQAILALATHRGHDATKGFNSALMQILKFATMSAQNDLNGLLAAYATKFFNGNVGAINSFTLTDSGLLNWYDATASNTITQSSSLVSSWANKISGGAALVQATGSKQPLYNATGLSSKPAIEFLGVDEYLTASISTYTSTAIEVFLVAKKNGHTDTTVAFCDFAIASDYTPSTVFNLDYPTNASTVNTFRNVSRSGGTSAANLTPYIFSTSFDGATNTAYLNNVAYAGLASTGSFNFNSILMGARWITAAFAPGRYYKGYVSELLVYNRALTTVERTAVSSYLASKYSIA